MTYEKRLKEIEDSIAERKEALQKNASARNNQVNKLCEEYLDLEDERRSLKLDIVNYNFAHIRCCVLMQIQEKEKKEALEKEREEERKKQ